MKVIVLASGSRGNCTYIEYNNTKILIDIGLSCLALEKTLNNYGVSSYDLDAILITHTHSDHVKGLKTYVKKHDTPIYMSGLMEEDLDFNIDSLSYIDNPTIQIKDLVINVIKTSHDTTDSNGYIVTGDKGLVYITDTGYINKKYFNAIYNKDIYVFESNHDIELLMNGKYPHHIKTRILGDRGHLSNKDSAYYLSHLIGDNTKHIILAHLSEENNSDDLALEALHLALEKEKKNVDDIQVAHQKESIYIEV